MTSLSDDEIRTIGTAETFAQGGATADTGDDDTDADDTDDDDSDALDSDSDADDA